MVVIFFVVEGLNVLKLDVLTDIGADIIGFMPTALAAVLILAATMIVSSMVEKAMRKNGMNSYAVVAKIAIIGVGIFMILSELGIATAIVNEAFTLIVSAVAIAFAIAFGIGGKEFAARTLKKLEEKKEEKKEDNAE